MRVFIVEDDINLARALQKILQDNGYEVDTVHSGTEGLSWAESGYYDVVVLDVMLLGMDGFEVSRQLRRAGVSTPILLLTARDAVPDKIAGLDSGADDYMIKPFSPAELMAHLRALTRRQGDVVFERLQLGDVALDLDSRELRCGAKVIMLSAKEFAIARILMENPCQVISKDQLMQRAWGMDSGVGENNVEAFISFLRKKLGHVGSKVKLENIHGASYRLVEAEGAKEAAHG
ncbi:response regulator transcription factor [Parvibacter caecicola]|uniref:response regulator transcription factor n=1 Tax=Parvibacter caecicola TaxID=747645 RepID=UPI00248C45D2|nr:response regulator transcription factor [Parvibacter caecicola]